MEREKASNLPTIDLPRDKWDTWDPMLIAEGLFAAANIFRYIFIYLSDILPSFCIIISYYISVARSYTLNGYFFGILHRWHITFIIAFVNYHV